MDEQQNLEASVVEDSQEAFDREFDEGFSLEATSAEEPEDSAPDVEAEPAPPVVQPIASDADAQEFQEVPPATTQVTQQQDPSPQPSVPQATPTVEIDEAIRTELAELETLNSQAAALAREVGPDGESIRRRLAMYGADQALDRAEMLLERRERDMQEAHAQQLAQYQAIEAHNRNFQQVVRTEHPELFAPTRAPEQNRQFMADMRTWIEGKPYAEARSLMEIYENGRDPQQVSALITRFKQEGTRKVPDPTAALAVAGRGAPNMPKDIGGKDDFDSGWNL